MTPSLSGFPPPQIRRLVIKIGSALLVDPKGEVRTAWLRTLVADIAARKAAGQQIIIVSSGAIALGARRLKLPKGGRGSLEDADFVMMASPGTAGSCVTLPRAITRWSYGTFSAHLSGPRTNTSRRSRSIPVASAMRNSARRRNERIEITA